MTFGIRFNTKETVDDLGTLDRTKNMIDTILKTIGNEWDLTLGDNTKKAIWNHLKVLLIMGSMAFDQGRKYGHIIQFAQTL